MKKMAEQGNDRLLLIGAVILLGIVTALLSRPTNVGPIDENWQDSYKASALAAGIDTDYFFHNEIIDTNQEIQFVAESIIASSVNAKDAVKKTMDYVYDTVEYTSSPPGCFQETSSHVLTLERGNCVSMTKLAVSLLREQGIAARPVGGCISGNFNCGVLYSAHPERVPRYVPVDLEDQYKRGGLHEWLEIWLPDEGWVIGEATSGQIFPKNCASYDIHDYNTDSIGMCVITDGAYIRACSRY